MALEIFDTGIMTGMQVYSVALELLFFFNCLNEHNNFL